MKKFFLIILLSGWVSVASAQNKYWIFFKDKPGITNTSYLSSQANANRIRLNLPVSQFTDAPVYQPYIDSLQNSGICKINTSKWLNAVSAYLDADQVRQVQYFPFIEKLQPVDNRLQISSYGVTTDFEPEYFTTVMAQLGADAFVSHGLSGRGITIGVIDVGFYGVHLNKTLQHLIEENKIMHVKDFVNPAKKHHFSEVETNADFHGTEVLQMIAGFEPEKKVQYGMAANAAFCLARTDHGVRETRIEEDNWVAAMEQMDSLGVRLINTSLGYAVGFTDPKENYKPTDMDGKTSIISKAAHIATEEKGMLLVVSAGNEGDDPNWLIVSTPADAEGVLSVGSTKAKSRDKIGYSSIGPDFLPYLKPNVACFSPSGTSFSAPVITGFAACLMEKQPSLTNKQVKHIIEKSAHLYPFGNNYIGYGVPSAAKALQLLSDSTLLLNNIKQLKQHGDVFSMKVEVPNVERAVIFHKSNSYFVIKQQLLAVTKGKLEFKRLNNETRTTIDFGSEIIEVFWE